MIERRDPLYTITHQVQDNWVAYFRKWSRQSLYRFYGRAQTYGNRSDNSRKPLHVKQTFETKIHRSESLAQVNLISAAPNAPKFEDRSQEETEWQEQGPREAAWKLAESVLKIKRSETEQHCSHFRKVGACLHQL